MLLLGYSVLLSAGFATLAHGQVVPSDALRQQIEAVVTDVKTATWMQTSWQQLGDREEYTEARCMWNGPDHIRLDVKKGRGKGATAILKEDTVHGFKRGLLSFAKLKFDVGDPDVLSLRGHDMRSSGFLDDLARLLAHWDTVTLTATQEGPVLAYTDKQGLNHQLWLHPEPLYPYQHEVYDGDRLVERYTYTSVVYHSPLDEKYMSP